MTGRNFKRILVARGGALGDFVLTLPALTALRGLFPAARLEILGYPRVAELAKAGGLADATHALEAPDLARWFAPDAPKTGRFAEYDLIVSYLFDPERIFESNVRRSAADTIFLRGPHRPDDNGGIHAAEALLAPLRELGMEALDPEPRLNLSNKTEKTDGLALHPGSGSERKNWPEEKWAELLGQLMDKTEGNFLLVGGEAEGDRLERLQNLVSSRTKFATPRVDLARNLPLVELAGRLQRCAGFVGHDSGVTHLAAALGVKGLVLWGETNPMVWRPLSSKMNILRGPRGLSRLPVEVVFGKLTELGIV